MKHSTYTSYDELPLMLSVAEVASVLGISRAGAYELAHSDGFPALKIGSRHRGAKPCRRCGLLGKISLLSPEYLLSVERRPFHAGPPDH